MDPEVPPDTRAEPERRTLKKPHWPKRGRAGRRPTRKPRSTGTVAARVAPKKAEFIAAFRRNANITESCRLAKLDRRTVYLWLDQDPQFKDDFSVAREDATDLLELEARRRAVDGWEQPVYQKGAEVGRIRLYSDRLMEVLLKGHRPETFKDRQDVNMTARVGPLQDPRLTADEELEARLAVSLAQVEALRARRGTPLPAAELPVIDVTPAKVDT